MTSGTALGPADPAARIVMTGKSVSYGEALASSGRGEGEWVGTFIV